MKKDCWWNENTKSGKDTAPLESPITPAESTKTEPPITGMLTQSDAGDEIPGQPCTVDVFGNETRTCFQR